MWVPDNERIPTGNVGCPLRGRPSDPNKKRGGPAGGTARRRATAVIGFAADRPDYPASRRRSRHCRADGKVGQERTRISGGIELSAGRVASIFAAIGDVSEPRQLVSQHDLQV